MGVTVNLIVDFVADRRDVPVQEILSNRRNAQSTAARHEACFLAQRLTPHSLPDIGRFLGGRDHTTVRYAINKIANKVLADPVYAQQIAAMSDGIKHSASRFDRVGLSPPDNIDPVAAARKVMASGHMSMTVSADEVRAMAMAVLIRPARIDEASKLRRLMPAVRDVVAAAAERDNAQYTTGERAAGRELRKSLAGLRAAIAEFEAPERGTTT